jgi:hypothetical protein
MGGVQGMGISGVKAENLEKGSRARRWRKESEFPRFQKPKAWPPAKVSQLCFL